MGIVSVSDVIQVDDMNDALRSGLWNVLQSSEFGRTGFLSSYNRYAPRIRAFSKALWADYFKKPIDERPGNNSRILEEIRYYFFNTSWYEVYDFVEFCADYYGEDLIEQLNVILERELAGYRIIDGKVAPISSAEDVEAIQEAISADVFPGASAHLKCALDLLSKKTDPDYRNSIKESISAVESASCAIAGSSTTSLGSALKTLSAKHSLHGALKDGFLKLYGYTSDGDGIRHAMLEESVLTQADAIYFLVSCSAFVNYLKVKMQE